MNKQIASKNQNLASTIRTLEAERKESQDYHLQFAGDKKLLASLRQAGSETYESLSYEGENIKLRMDLEALGVDNEKVKTDLVLSDKLGKTAEEEPRSREAIAESAGLLERSSQQTQQS